MDQKREFCFCRPCNLYQIDSWKRAMQKMISSQAKTSRHQHAVMLAKILMFAIDDFQELGMEEWGRLLNEGISEIMKKYGIDETDLRVLNHKAVN